MTSDHAIPLTIVHTDHGMCLTTTQFARWQEVQDAFSGYASSLGPWSPSEMIEYLAIEYSTAPPFADETVQRLAKSRDSTVWALRLSEDERSNIPANAHVAAAAADELLQRLDDLYDERADALSRLFASIDDHLPRISDSALGRVASDAQRRLIDLKRAQLGATALNRQALAATEELRMFCGSVWPRADDEWPGALG